MGGFFLQAPAPPDRYSPDPRLGHATPLGSLHTAPFHQLLSDFVSTPRPPQTLTSNGRGSISSDSISPAPVGTEDV